MSVKLRKTKTVQFHSFILTRLKYFIVALKKILELLNLGFGHTCCNHNVELFDHQFFQKKQMDHICFCQVGRRILLKRTDNKFLKKV